MFNIKYLKKSLVVKIILSLLVPFLIFFQYSHVEFKLYFTFYLIAVFSLFNMMLSTDFKNKITLNVIFNAFVFVFMSLAPFIQYVHRTSFFSMPPLSYDQCLITSKLILLSLFFYSFTYSLLNRLQKRNLYKEFEIDFIIDVKYLYLISFISGLFFLTLYNFELSVLFHRPSNNYMRLNSFFGVYGYGVSLLFRPIPLIVFYYYVLTQKKKNMHYFFLALIVLFFVFPFSLSRAIIAVYYMPCLIIFVPILKNKHIFLLCFFLGLFFLFPILNLFRSDVDVVLFGYDLINSGHFDSFYNSSNLIFNNLTTNGEQLISALFFFIPESIWHNRPAGTGKLLAEALGYSYTNISMSLWAEGFVNFGVYGLLLAIIFLAVFNSLMDVKYHNTNNKNVFFNMSYMFFIGLEFYLLRGDFRSGFSKIVFLNISIFLFFKSLNLIRK